MFVQLICSSLLEDVYVSLFLKEIRFLCFFPLTAEGLPFLLDLRSSSEKGETWTSGCHTRIVIKVQLHSKAKQIDAFGKLLYSNLVDECLQLILFFPLAVGKCAKGALLTYLCAWKHELFVCGNPLSYN